MNEERMNVAVHPLVRLRTTCGRELWAGFFGINENGDQPECGCEITEDVELESLEIDEDGTVRPCYAVECPECKGLLEWPQEWEIIETNVATHLSRRGGADRAGSEATSTRRDGPERLGAVDCSDL